MTQFTRRARKDFDQLPDVLQTKARSIVSKLDSEPALGKKLKGSLAGVRSVYLGRTHRILYRLEESGPLILTIAWRKDVYK